MLGNSVLGDPEIRSACCALHNFMKIWMILSILTRCRGISSLDVCTVLCQWSGHMDAIQVWDIQSVAALPRGMTTLSFLGWLERDCEKYDQQVVSSAMLLVTYQKAMEYCLVFFHFVPPSKLNRPCPLGKHAISLPHHVLT